MDCEWEVPRAYCTVCKRPLSSHRMSQGCSDEVAAVTRPVSGDGTGNPLQVIRTRPEARNLYLPSGQYAGEVQLIR
jgi:hypothetical protein